MTYELLQQGDKVNIVPSGTAVVREILGAGSQAEVYRVTVDGSDYALKWYYPGQATRAQRAVIERLIEQRPPSPDFLWPIVLCVGQRNDSEFGYLMPIRPAVFSSLYNLVTRRVEPSFYVILTAGMNLANAYLNLHSKGLCYRDISFGNAFFNPSTGEILVCDNDNVTVNGEQLDTVMGTQRFMAPEIVRGEAPTDTETDLFSLAVLLFYLLMMAHPLEGRLEAAIHAFDLHAMKHLYGDRPVFIFDPNDDSNRPVPGLHDNADIYWSLYPQSLRLLFTRAFTAGLSDPDERVREGQWRACLSKVRDSLLYCDHCQAENFYDTSRDSNVTVCWQCHRAIRPPRYLLLDRDIVVLNHDTKLFDHHLGFERSYDFTTALAEISQSPHDPSVWGLKNLGQRPWSATTPNGAIHMVEPGRSIRLDPGVTINFGDRTGKVGA